MSPSIPPIDRYLVRGAATTLVLMILRDHDCYGYQIVQEIRSRSSDLLDFGEGTVYPLLYGLEEDGAIKGDWKPGIGDRARKVYRITAKGKKELEKRIAAWERAQRGMKLAVNSF